MASEMYDELAAGAIEMLNEAGQPVTLLKPGDTTHDVDAGVPVVVPGSEYHGWGVEDQYESGVIDGTLILATDRRFYISPDLGTIPENGDVLVLDDSGESLRVLRSKPIKPAGIVVLHDVQIRS